MGHALLYVNGSASILAQSRPLIDLFGGSFDLVAFDHRGMGHSSPSGPYAMADRANDAVGGARRGGMGHRPVPGVSFGGMVAQEVAVTAPERVERLALLCTSAGGAGRCSR